MASKKQILNKVKILLTQSFDSPKKAFKFFDKNEDGKLNKKELKSLIKSAGVGGFISNIAAKQMIKGLDKTKDKTLDWNEFKKAVDSLLTSSK